MPTDSTRPAARSGAPAGTTKLFGAFRLALRAWGGALRTGAPEPLDLQARLSMVAADGAPVESPVVIRWSDQQIPFIEAESDRDLAVALGIVHAHLRLAQIEMMRRVATGRLSETIGAAAFPLDQGLRTIDFMSAGRQAARALSPEAEAWTRGFLDGLNHQIAAVRKQPHEFEVLGIEAAPWSFEELMAVTRLASTDFTWRVWMQLMKLRARSDWSDTWARLIGEELPEPSLAGGGIAAAGLEFFGRGGSNAYAVSGARTAGGKPILAGDPHLPLQLPNMWLIAGMKSPTLHAVGMMVPAVPVLGLGRNRHIAWGGTNLHAASSELVDLGPEPAGLTSRTERIRVRWGRDHEIAVRDSPVGPVISDASVLRMGQGRAVALHWIGHRASDEVSALLNVARARDWQGFLGALDGYAVPGLNLVYADADGHIGEAMAATLPRRPHARADDLISQPEALDHWRSLATTRGLPHRLDPEEGYVASANNAPPRSDIQISRFFSPDDRVNRLRELLGQAEGLTVGGIIPLQWDVLSPPALRLRDRLLPILVEAQGVDNAFANALRGWDGRYSEDSAGALAFELLVFHLVRRLHEGQVRDVYLASWDPWPLLHRDLDTIPRDRLVPVMAASAGAAGRPFRRLRIWGNAHRLRLGHALSRLPLVGGRYLVEERPIGGSNETLMKSRHGFSGGRHTVTFGSQARHIFDMADEDENHFVLLGGQDGWLGSSTFADQARLWREGRHLRVPLRPETVRAEFPHVTEIRPAGPGG
ncbi:penicillin acylase family protein [Lutibaculum baratangense]|uniref:Penicillin amidase n=1 Tax=Lutibaculum baratangense AMV1 TaxID=631454 RepID=V4RL95_9HYPH|nr:penicillin acylase family protein [Lutibaculum baratangense]ESR26826.1 hypothetical protein N177_0610 [Lutibaculum baratangense AMV1]